MRDWSVVKMPFKGFDTSEEDAIKTWTCTDMHQPEDALADDPVIDEEDYQNCYVYAKGSSITNGESIQTSRLLEEGRNLQDKVSGKPSI